MSGKIKDIDLRSLFENQKDFQKSMMRSIENFSIKDLPIDSVEWFMYHCTALSEELGEVLKSDKRWKTNRNTRYNKEEKLDEISDLLITIMNISMFSGFSASDLLNATAKKIEINKERLKDEKK